MGIRDVMGLSSQPRLITRGYMGEKNYVVLEYDRDVIGIYIMGNNGDISDMQPMICLRFVLS